MNHRRDLLAVFLLAALALTPPPGLLAQAIQKSLYLSVVDQSGAPVSGVGPDDVVVREDNIAREILRMTPADDPMQVAVLIDNSQAARSYIPDMRRALAQLVDSFLESGVKHDIAIIALAERPTILTDYTSDRARLQKGIDLVWSQPDSGTYLLDGLVEVTKGFKKRDAARPVIIAITTEGPELSSLHYSQILKPLSESGVAFHAVIVGPPSFDQNDDRSVVLDRGTRDTGGLREGVLASSGLPVRVKRLADALTHQYRVTYARPQSLIPPERVTVSTPRAGLTARATVIRDQQERQ